MTVIAAKQALTDQGWQQNVSVSIAANGIIERVETASTLAADIEVGILLPAPVNAHSHAFQRAMAGLTERRGPDPRDSFWTWRQLMYRFLDRLGPQQIEAITAFVQMEMLEAGYAAQVEFHYLHHQPGGAPYAQLAETSTRITAAAAQTGIGLTLLPVFYQYGGCDGRPLNDAQARFGNDPERFAQLLDGARSALATLADDAALGVAPHSLRAIAPSDLADVTALAAGGPIHMHLAEQTAEVDEVLACWGQRPTEWLLSHAEVDANWCLIHCTQMQAEETTALAASGAVAGLCPITEASLGDGIFDGVRWLQSGGQIAIGSDSNIRISLCEELRLLDYTQRLRDGTRAALATPQLSTGRRIYQDVCSGGAQAAGRDAGRIASGAWADLLALDDTAVDLAERDGDAILDSFIFVGDRRMVADVWSAGRHVVRDGRHIEQAAITRRYREAMSELRDAL